MTDSIHSSGALIPVYSPPSPTHRAVGPESSEAGRQAGERITRLPDSEQLRQYQAQAEERVEVLHPLRSLDEMPRRNQEALAAYQSTIVAAQAYEGGELVGLDVYV